MSLYLTLPATADELAAVQAAAVKMWPEFMVAATADGAFLMWIPVGPLDDTNRDAARPALHAMPVPAPDPTDGPYVCACGEQRRTKGAIATHIRTAHNREPSAEELRPQQEDDDG